MMKRMHKTEHAEDDTRMKRLAVEEQAAKVNDHQQLIPDEIISYIFSFYTDIQDVKKCSLLSQNIAGLINIEPTIVNRIRYSLTNVRKKDFLKFIARNGHCVRNLDVSGYWRIGSVINFRALPKLQELTVQSLSNKTKEVDYGENIGLNLPELRCLKTYNMTDLEDMIFMLSSTKNLTKFDARFDNNANHELWTNFIFQQDNLKDLSLEITSDDFNFPYRDVRNLLKFKLHTLKLSLPRIDQAGLLDLLNTQGPSLQTLDLSITDESHFPVRFFNRKIKFHPKKLKLYIKNPHEINFQLFIESHADTLEELDMEIDSDPLNFLQHPINVEFLELVKLKLCLKKVNHQNLLNFLSKLHNLKELELSISDMDLDEFPCRDISTEMSFKLKKFKYSLPDIDQDRFVEFLIVQAESLEELELNSITEFELLDKIFKNLKSIKQLTIDGDASEIIFNDDEKFPKFYFESLQYFHDKNQNGTIVSELFARFPNIETLKCCDTMQAIGTFPKLTTLDVSEIYWPRVRELKLPNLKNLFIKKISKCDDDYYWTHFPDNFLNIENITVQSVGIEDKDVFRFVEKLKVFEKLKTFKIRHGMAINHNFEMDENEKVKSCEKFFKILIDTIKRTIRVSTYIAKNRYDIMKILQKTFKKFDFFEFCFEEIKMKKIFAKELRKSLRFQIPENNHIEDQEDM